MASVLDQRYELRQLGDLHQHPANPRRGDLDAIRNSIESNGFYGALVVQKSTGYVLAGNHRVMAAEASGLTELPAMVVDVDEDTARRILLVDNRTNDMAGYDNEQLTTLLGELAQTDLGFVGTGYSAEELEGLLAVDADLDGVTGGPERALNPGEVLALVDVTTGEPEHKVEHGDVWQVGRHTLVVAKLHTEHHLWRHLLTDEMAFAPYPDPFFTCTAMARDSTVLFVQPNKYLAGHLLDKHASAFPDEVVSKA